MPFRPILVPSLLALVLACQVPAAELDWKGAPGDKPPQGWSIATKPETTITFLDRAIEITAAPYQQALAVAAIDLPDGSDERPMRLSAQVSAWGKFALTDYPALLALEWGGGAVFAVGLGDDPHTRGDDRRAWAVWNGGGISGATHAETELAGDASPAHLRIVLTSLEVAAYGSRDGWTWTRIAGVRRAQLGATGAPARVVLGRGQVRSGTAGLAADPPGEAKNRKEPCTYRFANLRIEADAPAVSAALLRGYDKRDSLADTMDALNAVGIPHQWRIRGPDDGRKTVPPEVLPAGFTAQDDWKPFELPAGQRYIQLGKLLPGGGNQLRWATTRMTTTEAGWTRFRFDGLSKCWLWVDGRLIAAPDRGTKEAEIDRLSASSWLSAGTHDVVMAAQGSDGRAAVVLRYGPGDPRWRIALLRRLGIDYAGDEQLIDAPFETARLWEGLGFAREAAAALADVAADDPEQAERAHTERARLYHQLGDQAAATAETTALQQMWSAAAVDPVVAARRTARLWQRLDAPERALEVLGEAIKLPGLDATTRCGLTVERARLRRAIGDEPGVAAELRDAAAMLPPGDQSRFDLLCASARLDPAMSRQVLQDLTKEAVDALRARQIAGMQAARKDEPARLSARRLAASLPGTPLALPTIELAEDLAGAKDEAGALKLYQQELARRKLPAAKSLAASRQAMVRAVLAETSAGSTLLSAAGRVPPATAKPLVWMARGPVPVGDWSAHEKPGFDPAKAPTDKEWKPVPDDQWSGGALDIGRIGGGDNVVWYLATIISSEVEGRVNASFGADDGLSVWLNGERLYSDRTQRGLTPDSIVLSLPLRKGINVLVCAVQNGGGPSSFQYRIRREPWPASDLSVALGMLADDRNRAAQVIADLAVSLVGAERTEEAWALARAVIACWPDRTDLIRDVAGRASSQAQWQTTPAALLELIGWFDAALADRRWEDADTRRWVQENVPRLLFEAGLVDEALARLRCDALVELEPLVVAGTYLREADIWLGMGYPRLATTAVQRARDAAPGEDSIEREADRRRRIIRFRKGDLVTIATPFELTSMLRTAERALGNDPERAARDFQQVVEGPSDQPVQLGNGRLLGASTYAAQTLRGASDEVRRVWQATNGPRAAAALARVSGDDPAALAAVSGRWPLAPAASEALMREADLWAARGAWELTRGSALRALAEFVQQPQPQAKLLQRAAEAAAHLGDTVALDDLLARLGKSGQKLSWDGRQVPSSQLAGILRGLLPPSAAAEPAPTGLIVRLPQYTPAMRLETVADARPPLPGTVSVDGLLVVATPDELAAIAEDGTLRWSLGTERDISTRAPDLATAGEAALAADEGVVTAGLRRSGSRRLVAVDAASGRQLWSSSAIPELTGATLASAPTMAGGRVWAWFVDAGRSFVACLAARDGAVLWRSSLGTGLERQPLSRAGDVFVAGNAPAPALNGRELFVSTDVGQVGAFDAVDGRLLWLHLYPRTAIDAVDGRTALRRLMARSRGQVLVDDQRVFVTPRDTLGILALDRADGHEVWSSELADVDELSALTPAGLVALGPMLTLHNPATGALRWRWRPSSGERPGQPALADGALWIPLRYGPLRLALADGGIRQGPAWRSLGLDQAPDGLRVVDGRLLGLDDGQVAVLAGGSGKPKTVSIAPSVVPVTGPAVPAVATEAPTALVERWRLPVGYISQLYQPGGRDDPEIYAVAEDRLYRIDGRNGRVLWMAPTAERGIRSIVAEGDAIEVLSEGLIAVHDRTTGRLRWSEPVSRDPQLLLQWNERWKVQALLTGDVVVRWNMGDGRFEVRDAADGSTRCTGRTEGGIWSVLATGDELHLLVLRNKTLIMERHRLADGVRIGETVLGPNDINNASMRRLSDDRYVVGTHAGGILWDASKHAATRLDLDMEWIHRVWRDGDGYTLLGQTDEHHRCAFLNASGHLLSQVEFAQRDEWQDRVRYAPRLIDGLEVRVVQERNKQTGVLVRTTAGAEQTWLPLREEWRRTQYGMIPLGDKAVTFGTDRDGWLRAQLIDPKAGKVLVDSALGMTMVSRVQPVTVAGGILVPTTSGLDCIVPVAAPVASLPGSELGDSHQPVWRLTKPLVVDGRLDEWEDQAGWEQDASQAARGGAVGDATIEPVKAWVAWRDDAVAMALSLPLPPNLVGSTMIAVDNVRGDYKWDSRPLLLALEWQGGAGRFQVLNRPVGEDPSHPSPPIQAQASSDGVSLTWEVLVPWEWLYPNGERPGRDQWLRWGAVTDLAEPAGAAVEFGCGLFPAMEKAGLVRLRLVDTKPGPDDKSPPLRQVKPKGPDKKKKK